MDCSDHNIRAVVMTYICVAVESVKSFEEELYFDSSGKTVLAKSNMFYSWKSKPTGMACL